MPPPHDLVTWWKPDPRNYCTEELSFNTSLGGGKPHPNHLSGYGWLEVKQDRDFLKSTGKTGMGAGWRGALSKVEDGFQVVPIAAKQIRTMNYCARNCWVSFLLPWWNTRGKHLRGERGSFRLTIPSQPHHCQGSLNGKSLKRKEMNARVLLVYLTVSNLTFLLLHGSKSPAWGMALLRLEGVFLHHLTRLRSSPQMWLQANSVKTVSYGNFLPGWLF